MNAFMGRGICLSPGDAAEDLREFLWVIDEGCGPGGSARRGLFRGEGVGGFAEVMLSAGPGLFATIVGARYGSLP